MKGERITSSGSHFATVLPKPSLSPCPCAEYHTTSRRNHTERHRFSLLSVRSYSEELNNG